jgi:succinoglycan biosynthesis protein ExoA
MSDPYPKLSVIVPVRNEEKYIARTLEFLLNQDYPKDKVEILVGIAESTDRTIEVVGEIAQRDDRVKPFRNPFSLSSGARSLGAKMATGEIVIYVDGHVWIDNEQIFKNTARLLADQQVSILSRPQFLDTPENSLFQSAVSLARKSVIGHGLDSTIYTVEEKYVDPTSSGATYRKEVFDRVGYFDPSFDACEDVEFNYRCSQAGFKSFISMKVAVYYYPRSSLKDLYKQMIRYGIGRFRLAKKHRETLSLSTLIPVLFVTTLPTLGIIGIFSRAASYLFAGAVLFYGMVVGSVSIAIAVKHGWLYLPFLPAILLTIHSGLGMGFLMELVRAIRKRS